MLKTQKEQFCPSDTTILLYEKFIICNIIKI